MRNKIKELSSLAICTNLNLWWKARLWYDEIDEKERWWLKVGERFERLVSWEKHYCNLLFFSSTSYTTSFLTTSIAEYWVKRQTVSIVWFFIFLLVIFLYLAFTELLINQDYHKFCGFFSHLLRKKPSEYWNIGLRILVSCHYLFHGRKALYCNLRGTQIEQEEQFWPWSKSETYWSNKVYTNL